MMTSRRVRAIDFNAPWLITRVTEMGHKLRLHRKLWEFAVIAETFNELTGRGRPLDCLGFGVGKEPLAAWFALAGANVLATDHPNPTEAWTATGQHAASIEDIPYQGIVDEGTFRTQVNYESADMRKIPLLLFGAFDFVWSCGSFEHLGSLVLGEDFVCNAMRCLRPGGLAAHTTEFNSKSNEGTLNGRDLALYRRRDLEHLSDRLAAQGDRMRTLDLEPGCLPTDRLVDEPPYNHDEPHLSLRLGGFVTTSVLVVIERGGEG